jgi:hypothetical protein
VGLCISFSTHGDHAHFGCMQGGHCPQSGVLATKREAGGGGVGADLASGMPAWAHSPVVGGQGIGELARRLRTRHLPSLVLGIEWHVHAVRSWWCSVSLSSAVVFVGARAFVVCRAAFSLAFTLAAVDVGLLGSFEHSRRGRRQPATHLGGCRWHSGGDPLA